MIVSTFFSANFNVHLIILFNKIVISLSISLCGFTYTWNVSEVFFLPFIKSVILDKHLIIIEKLNFLKWIEVQDDVIQQIEKFLNSGGLIFSKSNSAITIYVESTPNLKVFNIDEIKKCDLIVKLVSHKEFELIKCNENQEYINFLN